MNRVIAGIFVPGVDDAPLNPSQLMQIVFNEIVSEYSCFTSMEACSEALLKFERDLPNEEKLFSSIENTGKDVESSELKIDPSLIVFYQVIICLLLSQAATVFFILPHFYWSFVSCISCMGTNELFQDFHAFHDIT